MDHPLHWSVKSNVPNELAPSMFPERRKFYGELSIATFNMLSPCYKRLYSGADGEMEADAHFMWKQRLKDTLRFFQTHLLSHSVIALQEFWTNREYSNRFIELANSQGHQLHVARRHESRKEDALALSIDKSKLRMMQTKSVPLCNKRDRIGLIVWLYHKQSKKNLLIANTHLSFPHNEFDRREQINQIQILLETLNKFAVTNNITHASRIVLGDLNVESNSDVCDFLRKEGFASVMDVCPPVNGAVPPALGFPLHHRSVFVSHRTHRLEDLGVDHIFVKSEYDQHRQCDQHDLLNDRIYHHDQHYLLSTQSSSPCLFVSNSAILPTELSASRWHPEKYFSISDHRPVSSTMVFGKKI